MPARRRSRGRSVVPVSEVGALASSLTSCVPSVTAMTFLIKAPPSPSRRSHAVRDRPVMPGTRPTVGHAVRDRPAIPASMVNSGVKPPARRSTSAASEPSGGSSSRIDSTFENGEVANWGKFRDNEEFLSLIEADIQRAERSLVLDAKKKKAYKSILAIWKRSRPRGWQASQSPNPLDSRNPFCNPFEGGLVIHGGIPCSLLVPIPDRLAYNANIR